MDDLNTPLFIAKMQGLLKDANKGNSQAAVSFKLGLQLLGFDQIEYASQDVANFLVDDTLQEEVEAAIGQRLAFIREKNWAEADRIRDELAAQGIQLKDSKNKETGERETTWEVKR